MYIINRIYTINCLVLGRFHATTSYPLTERERCFCRAVSGQSYAGQCLQQNPQGLGLLVALVYFPKCTPKKKNLPACRQQWQIDHQHIIVFDAFDVPLLC